MITKKQMASIKSFSNDKEALDLLYKHLTVTDLYALLCKIPVSKKMSRTKEIKISSKDFDICKATLKDLFKKYISKEDLIQSGFSGDTNVIFNVAAFNSTFSLVSLDYLSQLDAFMESNKDLNIVSISLQTLPNI